MRIDARDFSLLAEKQRAGAARLRAAVAAQARAAAGIGAAAQEDAEARAVALAEWARASEERERATAQVSADDGSVTGTNLLGVGHDGLQVADLMLEAGEMAGFAGGFVWFP